MTPTIPISEALADANLLGAPEGRAVWPCPHCGEQYKIVETEAGPETVNREITCLTCGGPLQGRRGKYIRKYFRIKKAPGPRQR